MSTLKVNTIQDTTGNDALTIDSSGNVTASQGFVPSTQLSHRNLIINGAMQVSQRGDYTSATSTTNNDYKLDRWKAGIAGVTATVQHTSMVADGFTVNAIKYAATSSASGYLQGYQIVEDYSHLAGKQVTFSAYVKSNVAATLYIYDGVSSTTFASTKHTGDGTVQKLTVTATMNSSPTTLLASVSTYDGASYNHSSGDYIEFSMAQLEVGSVATPFEHRSYGEELARCQRYYYKTYRQDIAPGTNSADGLVWLSGSTKADNTARLYIRHPVDMRTAPTATFYQYNTGTTGIWNYERSGADGTVTTTAENMTDSGGRIKFAGIGASWVVADWYGQYTMDAEL